MKEIVVRSRWEAISVVEIEDADDADGIAAELQGGGLNVPDYVADQITATGAELIDWSVER